MKKLIGMIAGIFILSILFIGCDNDDDENSDGTTLTSNYIEYLGTQYELTDGFLDYYGLLADTLDAYNFDLYLYSGFTISSGYFYGTGHLFVVEIFSSDSTDLAVSEYGYDSDGTGDADTYDYGEMYLNYNITNYTGTLTYITDGAITVTANGDEYEIDISCTDINGNSITGNYTGSLDLYDETEDSYSLKTSKNLSESHIVKQFKIK